MNYVVGTIFCIFVFIVGLSMVIGAADVGHHIGRCARDGYDGATDMYNAAVEEAARDRNQD